ncbi:MAG: metallophosphoesterase [Pseudomonadota bacterium]
MNHRKMAAALAVFGLLAIMVDSFLIEPARLVVKRADLELPNWPAELAGLRVALLSDLHVGSPHWGESRIRELIAQVNAEHPELILLAGDYLVHDVKFGTRVSERFVAEALGELHAPLGVVAVFGNHDCWKGPVLRPLLEAKGIHVLEDEAFVVQARGSRFCVLGLADDEVRKRTASEEYALAPADMPLLVLVHEPDIFADLDARVSLTLAGHTHGGQVRLPFFGPPVVRSRYGARYAAGHIVENDRQLFVTTGIGTSVWPVRFGVPPEYVILTLR